MCLLSLIMPGSQSFCGTETTLSKLEKSSLLLAYEVNAIGPVLVIKVCSSNSFYDLSLTLNKMV
jgi:hypothetical protein